LPAGSGEENIFKTNKCKYGFPYCDPSRSQGTMNDFEFPLPKRICTKFEWNWSAGSGEDISIYTHVNMVFPIVASPDPEDHNLNKLKSTSYQKAFI
jgi:hypothetical protein